MRGMKSLLGAVLVLVHVVGCGERQGGPSAAKSTDDRNPEFGDFGYSNIYRYYGGPSAVRQESAIQRGHNPHMTQR